jgi:Zn-dependent M32 family carboxypeptidase
MRGLVFAQSVNRPDRHDATGEKLNAAHFEAHLKRRYLS